MRMEASPEQPIVVCGFLSSGAEGGEQTSSKQTIVVFSFVLQVRIAILLSDGDRLAFRYRGSKSGSHVCHRGIALFWPARQAAENDLFQGRVHGRAEQGEFSLKKRVLAHIWLWFYSGR